MFKLEIYIGVVSQYPHWFTLLYNVYLFIYSLLTSKTHGDYRRRLIIKNENKNK